MNGLIIYGALFIPVIAALVLLKYFRHHMLWWEFLAPFLASLILVVVSKVAIENYLLMSKEYWGSFIENAEYYEDWNEKVSCRHSYDCNCGTDEDGNKCCCSTCYEHAYDVDYHPEYWQINTTTKEVLSINQRRYEEIKKLWANENFVELNRDYHTDDGDKYVTVWKRDSLTSIPVTTIHYYENRIKAAKHSVFHYEVDTSDIRRYKLFEYPPIYDIYKQNAVLGENSNDAQIANLKIQYLNALLGSKKEVKVFMLIFTDQPVEAAMHQESYWFGGNMNELVIAIGINKSREVKWCYPFSWTTNERMKTDVKNYVQEQKELNLTAVANYLLKKVDSDFQRRDFKEFSYLTVEPPLWAIVLTYLLTIAINIAISWWAIDNDEY